MSRKDVDRLSPHFRREEFACRCGCGTDTVDAALITVLEKIRSHFDAPIKVTSGIRCPDHNRAVGGASNSQHLYGKAADIQVKGVEPAAVAGYAEYLLGGCCGVGRYSSFTHVDVRPDPARWG